MDLVQGMADCNENVTLWIGRDSLDSADFDIHSVNDWLGDFKV